MDERWGVERELEGNGATERVSDDMRLLHAQVSQQRLAVGGLLRDANRTGSAAAVPIAATAVVMSW